MESLGLGRCTALNASQRRAIDGFQAPCLRHLLKIAPAYVSRVANKDVLVQAGRHALSKDIIYHQLVPIGKAAQAGPGSALHDCAFALVGLLPSVVEGPRRRGRPRRNWCADVRAHAVVAARGMDLQEAVESEAGWKRLARRFVYSGL